MRIEFLKENRDGSEEWLVVSAGVDYKVFMPKRFDVKPYCIGHAKGEQNNCKHIQLVRQRIAKMEGRAA